MKFPRIPHKYVVYDKLHRGTVLLLISCTAIIGIRMTVDMFSYSMVKKPILREKARYEREAEFEELRAKLETEAKEQQFLQDQVSATAKH